MDPKLVVFTTRTEVYKSEQGGEHDSWQTITPPREPQIQAVALSPHRAQVYVVGTRDRGIYYSADGGVTWTNNDLKGFFEQRLSQGSDRYLDAEIATALNPKAWVPNDISAVAFDQLISDTFYAGGSLRSRASFGVARITNAGQSWERLPLAGLTHRNISDLAVDSRGEFLYAGTNDGTFRFNLR